MLRRTVGLAAVCALLWAALAVTACSKVREPEPTAAPKVIGQDGQTRPLGGPPPVIAADQPSFDFGKVAQGEDAVHTFTIRNKGQGVLKIQNARGG